MEAWCLTLLICSEATSEMQANDDAFWGKVNNFDYEASPPRAQWYLLPMIR